VGPVDTAEVWLHNPLARFDMTLFPTPQGMFARSLSLGMAYEIPNLLKEAIQ
jgi:hypothetical protein